MTTTDSMNVWLDGITLYVADVERSLKFYQHIPGAVLEHHRPREFALLRLGQATRLGLLGFGPSFHLEISTTTSTSPPPTARRRNQARRAAPRPPLGRAPSTSSTPTATASSSPAAEISRIRSSAIARSGSATGTAMCVTQWGLPAESSGCSAQCRRPSHDQWGMRRPSGTPGTRSACLNGGMAGVGERQGVNPRHAGQGVPEACRRV